MEILEENKKLESCQTNKYKSNTNQKVTKGKQLEGKADRDMFEL